MGKKRLSIWGIILIILLILFFLYGIFKLADVELGIFCGETCKNLGIIGAIN